MSILRVPIAEYYLTGAVAYFEQNSGEGTKIFPLYNY